MMSLQLVSGVDRWHIMQNYYGLEHHLKLHNNSRGEQRLAVSPSSSSLLEM